VDPRKGRLFANNGHAQPEASHNPLQHPQPPQPPQPPAAAAAASDEQERRREERRLLRRAERSSDVDRSAAEAGPRSPVRQGPAAQQQQQRPSSSEDADAAARNQRGHDYPGAAPIVERESIRQLQARGKDGPPPRAPPAREQGPRRGPRPEPAGDAEPNTGRSSARFNMISGGWT
jgi:hypothetical protein